MSDSGRLDEVPRMRWGRTTIPAACFNQVRLGLLRLGGPLRFAIGLRDIEMIVDDEVWYCVDAGMDDLPIVAWDEFAHRDTLHAPVECRISFYHQHADIILERVFEALDGYLEKQLKQPKRILDIKT